MYGLDLIHETHENFATTKIFSYMLHIYSLPHTRTHAHTHTHPHTHMHAPSHIHSHFPRLSVMLVRQRAIDLLYAMCDHTNAQTIVEELLHYLEKADYSIRETLV